MTNGIDEMNIECIEMGILLETINAKTTRTMKLNIPKLMPLVNASADSSKTERISSNILLNDPNTIPTSLNNSLTTLSYISVPIADSCFRGPYGEDKYGRIIVKEGTSIMVIIPNKNIQNMKATDF